MNGPKANQKRRSVRHFDPAHKIGKKELDKLLSLALHSPTSFNIQNWRFVVIQDNELRSKIRKASWDQEQITDASVLIILCADVTAWEKEPIRYWQSTSDPIKEITIPAIEQYYSGLDQAQRDEAMRSCGIAAQTIMLAAKSMGYDSCPINGFDIDAVAELIYLPDDHAICMFVAIGKEIEVPDPGTDSPPVDDVVVKDHF